MKVRVLLAALPALVIVGCGVRDPEMRMLQGTWTAASADIKVKANKGPKKDQLTKTKITFEGDNYAMEMDGRRMASGKYRLYPKKNPKEIDLLTDDKHREGIYKVEGDELVLCLRMRGMGPPAQFAASSETKRETVLFVFARSK